MCNKNDDANDNRFITEGVIKETKKDVKEINELPIGVWTNIKNLLKI